MADLIKVPSKLPTSQPKYLILGRSGYYSPPQDCIVTVHVIGGGGGSRPGYRGGGGGYAAKTLRLNGGAVYNVTIAAGGSGGGANTPAGRGGNTSFQGLGFEPIIGYGGFGGNSSPSPTSLGGGQGGKASGGDINREGTHGNFRGKVDVYGKLYSDDFSDNADLDNFFNSVNIINSGIFGRAFGEAPSYIAPSGQGGKAGIGSGSTGPSLNGGQGIIIVEEF